MDEKILVVDDEASIVTLLEFNLTKSGFEVITASDGEKALHLAEQEKPDLVLLDLMLPKVDGLEVCKQIREKHLATQIVMLTAKDDEFDKVLGLELGADDYVTKPFSPREVVARVKAVLRRSSQASEVADQPKEERIVIAELEIYPERYETYFRGAKIDLTVKEFELLGYLARHKGQALPRERLMNAVWGYDYVGGQRIVDVHISHLREKIEPNARNSDYIKTIRGLGYKLEEPK
ncbi:MAG TPA: response regulator [Bacillales bacterium]|nr:response regulator [Bacillales bacterium]